MYLSALLHDLKLPVPRQIKYRLDTLGMDPWIRVGRRLITDSCSVPRLRTVDRVLLSNSTLKGIHSPTSDLLIPDRRLEQIQHDHGGQC